MSSSAKQYLFIVRHGDRWDYSHPEWRNTAERLGDPPLSNLGQEQARETGTFLDSVFAENGLEASNIKFLSSPFLRCIQTCDGILSQLESTKGNAKETIMICPEKSVWELDGKHGGALHACLPTVRERKCYFPRVDTDHESLFEPPLPETRSEFVSRCDKVMTMFNEKYEYAPNTAFVVVTHAAGCVCLAKSAAGLKLSDINAAGPCNVFGLTRTSNAEKWDIGAHDEEGGWNAYSSHLTDEGKHTVPWNHFGPNGAYSGPPLKKKKET